MRQVDVAAALGISQSALSRKINGDAEFTVDEVLALAELFDVGLAQLIQPAVVVALPRLDSNQEPAGYGYPGRFHPIGSVKVAA